MSDVEIVDDSLNAHKNWGNCQGAEVQLYDTVDQVIASGQDDSVRLIILHGAPDPAEVTQLLRHRPSAWFLLVSSASSTRDTAQELAKTVGPSAQDRLFGTAVAGSLQKAPHHVQELADYFCRQKATRWVDTFLGLDSPTCRRMVLMALEVVRWDLTRDAVDGDRPDAQTLLKPALTLAQGCPPIEQVVAPLKEILASESAKKNQALLARVEAVITGLQETHDE